MLPGVWCSKFRAIVQKQEMVPNYMFFNVEYSCERPIWFWLLAVAKMCNLFTSSSRGKWDAVLIFSGPQILIPLKCRRKACIKSCAKPSSLTSTVTGSDGR